jgi:hypothetical protein
VQNRVSFKSQMRHHKRKVFKPIHQMYMYMYSAGIKIVTKQDVPPNMVYGINPSYIIFDEVSEEFWNESD